jgi:mannose-6-phosphate isomerase-like protein (cupin superfamily)
MAGYAIVERQDAPDFMAQYPGYGEMRFFADALGGEQVAFTWRLMPPGTGGKGSYGHRHRTQEEIYFVTRGKLMFKLGDDVVEVDPHTAVRVSPDVFRSVHNDGPDEAELVICSIRSADAEHELETTPDFWPEER